MIVDSLRPFQCAGPEPQRPAGGTADELIVQLWSSEGGGSDGLTRRRNHVSYLMEAARLAVRAAM